MRRNSRKRITFVLPLANNAAGHRLGVNGLAVDPQNSILYSGGRDGVICAWDLNLDLTKSSTNGVQSLAPSAAEPSSKPPPTTFRQQVQAHTHWINDIALAQNNEALVSASSDITVKLWRPAATDALPPQTIGRHADYVKCLASPSQSASWIASGGLDRKICLWDLNGGGQQFSIAVGADENAAKGSVYALAVNPTLIAAGGPENIIRVWDPRSGKSITKFVGHTDNIRDLLVTDDGDTIMSASSDQTVKLWSMTAGRCMHTLTMHNDSVWSLYSDHPQLSVFYSSDRSGLVAKTDTRGCAEIDEGISVAVCQEHEGVNKVIQAGNYIWTSTSNSGINRWNDVDTEVELPEAWKFNKRSSVSTSRSRISSPQLTNPPPPSQKQIPVRSLLRLSNTAPPPMLRARDADSSTIYSSASARKPSDALLDADPGNAIPIRSLPDFSIEGQNGLIKHVLLNDRRRVLTLDTAGEVTLWDLLQCAPIKTFGKHHLEDVAPEVNTTETVAHWCAVDTRTGSLTCVLEENYCFDAEMYADELNLDEHIDFREDQRINLGKWILRYLFAGLIDEEIRRDQTYREQLLNEKKQQGLQRCNAPSNIDIPNQPIDGWKDAASGPTSASTLRASNGSQLPLTTPGLAIGVATPAVPPPTQGSQLTNSLPPTAEEGTAGSPLERKLSQTSQGYNRTSTDKGGDYFSSPTSAHPPSSNINGKSTTTSSDAPDESTAETAAEPEKETQAKKGNALFGKQLRMAFGMKKNKTQTAEAVKPAAIDEKSEDSDSRSSKTEDRLIEDNFFGSIQRIRHGYEDQIQEGAASLATGITPSLSNETPVLKPPANTTILIQEDKPDSGGVADLFEGKVGSLGQQADQIEKAAPMWLGELLLRNQTPLKDIVKVSFVLEPLQGLLPDIASDGNNRLNANRMLRARKILAYIAERIEPMPSEPDPNALRPEEYLELYCQNQLIPPTMTLATIRTHVWRGGGDVLLYYKANGRKEIKHFPDATAQAESGSTAGSEGKDSEGDASNQHS